MKKNGVEKRISHFSSGSVSEMLNDTDKPVLDENARENPDENQVHPCKSSENKVIIIQKEFDVPLVMLYNAWSDKKTRCMWFPCIGFSVKNEIPRRLVELDCSSPSGEVFIHFSSLPDKKSMITILQQEVSDMKSACEVEAFWFRVLDQLNEYVASTMWHSVILDY